MTRITRRLLNLLVRLHRKALYREIEAADTEARVAAIAVSNQVHVVAVEKDHLEGLRSRHSEAIQAADAVLDQNIAEIHQYPIRPA